MTMESPTTMTDEQKRIRGYLEAQGAKLTPTAIVEKVRGGHGTVARGCSRSACRTVRRVTRAR